MLLSYLVIVSSKYRSVYPASKSKIELMYYSAVTLFLFSSVFFVSVNL